MRVCIDGPPLPAALVLITFRVATPSTHCQHQIQCGAGVKTAAEHRIVGASKVVTNERPYPYLVEIPVAPAGLDIALNRQIVQFHKSQRIQLRHGRTI
jgi:hypothetical protein